jgi:hypothetical protein
MTGIIHANLAWRVFRLPTSFGEFSGLGHMQREAMAEADVFPRTSLL